MHRGAVSNFNNKYVKWFNYAVLFLLQHFYAGFVFKLQSIKLQLKPIFPCILMISHDLNLGIKDLKIKGTLIGVIIEII